MQGPQPAPSATPERRAGLHRLAAPVAHAGESAALHAPLVHRVPAFRATAARNLLRSLARLLAPLGTREALTPTLARQL